MAPSLGTGSHRGGRWCLPVEKAAGLYQEVPRCAPSRKAELPSALELRGAEDDGGTPPSQAALYFVSASPPPQRKSGG